MTKVLLHSCCAPCSAAILEWMLQNSYAPTIYYFNPNIYPEEEYLKRKNEITRYAHQLEIPIVDDDHRWNEAHARWLEKAAPLADEPERGARCLVCFRYRLFAAAEYAAEHGFPIFTTTLASSRWKDLNQINEAGHAAEALFQGRTEFWDRNWRKGGLYERRNLLARQFYNQQYCGCEFSMRRLEKTTRP